MTDEEVRAAFADDIAEILQPVAQSLTIDAAHKPHVVLVIGVNGSGKTTTIAKLAHLYKGEGKKVMLAAGDTFRAAAVEQLKVWGDRAGVPVIAKGPGADAAGLAYEALEKARAERCDVLLIDTAGRLHNKTNLMEELAKIVRVIRKLDPSAPHSCLLVLDATVGQNAPCPGRDLQEPVAGRCAGGDQARRQRQGRRAGGAGREVQAAGGGDRRRRGHRRPAAVRGAGFREGLDGLAGMSDDIKPEKGMRKLYATALELGPLLLFFAANSKWGIFIGTGVFIVATAICLPCYRWMEGRWPVMPMVGGFFVLVFGGLTIWLQDETFIKLKPTIVNCLFGVILGGGLLLLKRPLLKPIFGAAFQLTDEGWRKLTVRWALFFFLLAAINEFFWRGFSTDTWIASKMFVSFPATLVFAFFQIPLLKRHWEGDDNPFA